VRGLAFGNVLTFPAINAPNHVAVAPCAPITGVTTLQALADILACYQNADGSWNWHSDLSAFGGPTESDKDTQVTAYAVLALLEADIALGTTQYADEVALGRSWLRTMQLPDGGFLSYPGGTQNNEVEGEALWALAPDTCTDNVLEFLLGAGSDCVQPGETVTVELHQRNLLQLVDGFQAFAQFNSGVMTHVSNTFTATPYGQLILNNVTGDDIDLAAGIDLLGGQPSTMADALLVTLTFTAGATEGPTNVWFRTHLPPTRFTDPVGQEVTPCLLPSPTIVIDGTPPVITCPSNVVLECPADTSPTNTGFATATDNLDCAPTVTYSDVVTPGVCPQEETITRTWTAEDCAGNTDTCVQTIDVVDTTPPDITCPDDIVVNADAGGCDAVVDVGQKCFGDYTFNPTFEAYHFDDVFDLTQYDLTLTYTIDLSQVTQTVAYETPYVEVGLREVGAADFNPGPFDTYQGGAGGWMTSLVGDLATDPNLLDLDDKHNLSASGGRGESDYDVYASAPNVVVAPPFGSFNTRYIWFDRDGVDPWQDTKGANTGGTYDITIRYHAINAGLGSMIATINGNGIDTVYQEFLVGGTYYAGGLSFLGDMTQMQLFYGAWYTAGAGGPVTVSNMCLTASARAIDDCDPDPDITAVRSDGLPLTDPYPPGVTTITWRATDDCGNYDECDQTVTVTDYNELVVTVELSPNIDTGDPFPQTLTRCITFELWECIPLTGPVTVTKEIDFTVTAGVPNVAIGSALITNVPCGYYDCITARDELHTLRRTDETFGIVGTQYVADLSGDPAGGGDWLIGGNLNDDYWIDILDFGVFSWQWAVNYTTGDTTCSTPYPHADISGDGLVNNGDFGFIQINFLDSHEANCCGQPGLPPPGDGPVTEISVAELHGLGLEHLAVADLNGDAMVDQADVAAFAMGARPQQVQQAPPVQPRPLRPGLVR
jgi:hypothetical protein